MGLDLDLDLCNLLSIYLLEINRMREIIYRTCKDWYSALRYTRYAAGIGWFWILLEPFSSRIRIFSEMGTEGDYGVTKSTLAPHLAVNVLLGVVTPYVRRGITGILLYLQCRSINLPSMYGYDGKKRCTDRALSSRVCQSKSCWPWCGPIFQLIGLIIGTFHISDFEI